MMHACPRNVKEMRIKGRLIEDVEDMSSSVNRYAQVITVGTI